jgi:hypothetical protein
MKIDEIWVCAKDYYMWINIGDKAKIIKVWDAQKWRNEQNRRHGTVSEKNEYEGLKNRYIVEVLLLKNKVIDIFYSEDFIKIFRKIQ